MERTVLEPTDLPVLVVVVGADNQQGFHDVVLKPGTRCIDVLRDLNLEGYGIRKPDDSGEFFAGTDDLYAAVRQANVSKIEAVPDMPVARNEAGSSEPAALRHGPITVQPRSARVIERGQARLIRRNPRPLWEERGWQRINNHTWRGQYALPEGRWDGEIVRSATTFRPWIMNPPIEIIQRHRHPNCLIPAADGRYFLHFGKDPNSVDCALLMMEKFLAESYVAAGRRSR